MMRLAVIGNPIAHSRSPEIHHAFAGQAGLEIHYEKLLAEPDAFAEVAQRFLVSGGAGFNVTVPFKFEAYELVDEYTAAAAAAGTVNTVVSTRDGHLLGDNTDGRGLRADLETNLGWALTGKRVLILGAGGAVQGVIPALIDAGPGMIHISNRTHDRAIELARRYPGTEARLPHQLEAGYDVVINGSSAGLGGTAPDIVTDVVGPQTHAYDMVYGKGDTPFEAWAIEAGATETANGLGMLVEQAALAFTLWTGFEPQTRPVIETLRASL